ncbi:MAG: two-component regulator propeller domain-containing protein [Chitinophagales bacterium]
MKKTNLFPYKTAFWAVLLLLSLFIRGEEIDTAIHFDHLTIQEGLSHNTVYCLLQDQNGYIWIGTQNGLNKYDGYTFEIHRSNGKKAAANGFVGKSVSALFEDSQGNMWVGTRMQGINFRPKTSDKFIHLQLEAVFAAILGYEITSFFEDKAGNIWISTLGGGILKYNLKTKTSEHFNARKSGLHNDFTFDILEDKYGTIWAVTAGFGLNYLSKGKDQFSLSNVNLPNTPNMSGYRKTLFLNDEYLWIGTEGTGLYRMRIKDQDYTHFGKGTADNDLNSNVVRDIFEAKGGQLFIATDGGGLNVLDKNTGKISKYGYQIGETTALNSNALFCFLEDRTGNIWIGTYNGGINIHKTHKTWFEFFTPLSNQGNALAHRSVLSLFQGKDGKIWVGTDGGGLNWLTPQNDHFSIPSFKHNNSDPQSIAGNVVKTIFEDSQSRLWIGLFGTGLDMYNPTSQKFQHYKNEYDDSNSLSENNVWSIAERKDGKLWIGTIGNGLNLFNPETEKFTVFKHNPAEANSLAENNIMVVFVSKDDQVWIGTADKGLNTWDDTRSLFLHYNHNPEDSLSISNDEIRAIFEDSRGNIWIGTEGGGLNRWLGDGKFERLTKEDGLIANSIMGITEDQDSMIWLTTFEGISRLNPKTRAVRNFDFHSGQNNNQFNQMASLRAMDGKLFFGGINGLNAIRPEQIKENDIQPNLVFTDFKVFHKSIPVGKLPNGQTILEQPIEQAKEVTLSYFDNSFSIDFAAIDYTNPLENTFSYKMEGFDEHWQSTSLGQHSATYTNLDPDTYTFKVRHKDTTTSIEVHIHPPFWQTIWFRVLVLILLAGLIGTGMFLLVKRREAVHKQELLEAKGKILQLSNEKLEADQKNLQLNNENLEAQSENLQLQNEKLETEVNAKNSKLMFSAVQMAHKNEILTKIKKELRAFQKEPDTKLLRQLQLMLNRELENENYWEEFNLYFNQVDQNFIQAILKKHPQLTKNDLRMCTLMRINLSTKEIASLLNVSVRGVEQSRYRLKKRIGLEKEEDLLKYVMEF